MTAQQPFLHQDHSDPGTDEAPKADFTNEKLQRPIDWS